MHLQMPFSVSCPHRGPCCVLPRRRNHSPKLQISTYPTRVVATYLRNWGGERTRTLLASPPPTGRAWVVMWARCGGAASECAFDRTNAAPSSFVLPTYLLRFSRDFYSRILHLLSNYQVNRHVLRPSHTRSKCWSRSCWHFWFHAWGGRRHCRVPSPRSSGTLAFRGSCRCGWPTSLPSLKRKWQPCRAGSPFKSGKLTPSDRARRAYCSQPVPFATVGAGSLT